VLAHEEPIMKGSFKAAGPGKVVLVMDNRASKNKKLLLYRFRVKSTAAEPAAEAEVCGSRPQRVDCLYNLNDNLVVHTAII
jgi:hypothetical protein